MTEIIRVSKVGNNAITGTAPDNLVFSSDYNTLKYYSSGSVVATISGSNGEGSVTHNLGYIPFFTAYVNGLSPSNTWSMCHQTFSDFGAYLYLNAFADATNLYFTWETASASNTVTFYYKIFRNKTYL